jgi:hypothetical protein
MIDRRFSSREAYERNMGHWSKRLAALFMQFVTVRAAVRARVAGFAVVRGPLLRRYLKRIADLTIENHLPCMCEGTDAVEAGGLMSYSFV